jgi:cytochrome c biogenesis protein CcmG/thiol:disulfide interchange protein DsbE
VNTRKAWIAVGVVAIIIMVVSVAFVRTLNDNESEKHQVFAGSPLLDKPAPPLVLDDLAGDGTVQLSDHLGDVIIVNFWSSSCLSCRAEHADMAEAAAHYADADVTFFGVDIWDTLENGRAYLDQYGWIPGAVYGIDYGSTATFSYGVTGTPETFFIDPGGIVVAKVIGPVTYGLLTSTIDGMLAG